MGVGAATFHPGSLASRVEVDGLALVGVALGGCFATVRDDRRRVDGEAVFTLTMPEEVPTLVVVQPGVSVVSNWDNEVFYADGYLGAPGPDVVPLARPPPRWDPNWSRCVTVTDGHADKGALPNAAAPLRRAV